MAYTKTNWVNDNVPAINATNLNHIEQGIYDNSVSIANLINNLFPIGQIIIRGDNADYSSWLGFTWERTAVGKVLVGYDSSDTDFDTIGKTGGEKEVQLDETEIPSHTHGIYGALTGETKSISNVGNDWGVGTTQAYTTATSSTGGDQAHNNLQPYQVVAYWKRIS